MRSQFENLDAVAKKALIDAIHLVEQTTREVRTISHLLHPPLLDIVGLASALRWYGDGFAERSKISVDFRVSEKFPRLSDESELAIFRLVQECLTNIHRHSGSKNASIAMHLEGADVIVQIKDSGRGMPASKQFELNSLGGSGVGFRGMRERLRQLGGDVQILSDDSGTVVTARLPYRPGSRGDQGSHPLA